MNKNTIAVPLWWNCILRVCTLLGAILQLDYYGYLNENVIGKSAHIFGNTYLDK